WFGEALGERRFTLTEGGGNRGQIVGDDLFGPGDRVLVHQSLDVCQDQTARAGQLEQEGDDWQPSTAVFQHVSVQGYAGLSEKLDLFQALLERVAAVRRIVLIGSQPT